MSWDLVMLADGSSVRRVLDVPWRIGGRSVPWMSSEITVMILAALLLAVLLPWGARRRTRRGGYSVGLSELLVNFIRQQMAQPTLGKAADAAVPFLATLFVFLLTCNLLSLVPLMELSEALGLSAWGGVDAHGRPLNVTPVGGTPASTFWLCAAFAGLTLVVVMLSGYARQFLLLWKGRAPAEGLAGAHGGAAPTAGTRTRTEWNLWHSGAQFLRRRTWPAPVAAVAAVYTWLDAFVPPLPGLVGLVMWPLLLGLEVMGYMTRSFALAIRLVANMTGGHILLAVLVGFAEVARGWQVLYVGVPAGIGAVGLMLLEVLVAVIQAYIFTFLSGLFIGLATAEH